MDCSRMDPFARQFRCNALFAEGGRCLGLRAKVQLFCSRLCDRHSLRSHYVYLFMIVIRFNVTISFLTFHHTPSLDDLEN